MNIRTILVATSAAGLLAGCAAKAPPPAPAIARVAPPPLVAPPRPQRPAGTAATFATPPRDTYGRYATPNNDLPPEEALWHMRMGLNVAALSCFDATDSVNAAYGQFLTIHKKRLADANKAMDALWTERAGKSGAKSARDTHSVEVYNFFALPMVTPTFCSTAMQVLATANATPSADLASYASVGLGQIEGPFTRFFTDYDAYKVADAAWYRVYGPAQPVRAVSASGPVTTFQSGEVTYDPVTNQPVERPLTGEADATAAPAPGAGTASVPLGATPPAPTAPADPTAPSSTRR